MGLAGTGGGGVADGVGRDRLAVAWLMGLAGTGGGVAMGCATAGVGVGVPTVGVTATVGVALGVALAVGVAVRTPPKTVTLAQSFAKLPIAS